MHVYKSLSLFSLRGMNYFKKIIEAVIIKILDNRQNDDNKGHEEYFLRWFQFLE